MDRLCASLAGQTAGTLTPIELPTYNYYVLQILPHCLIIVECQTFYKEEKKTHRGEIKLFGTTALTTMFMTIIHGQGQRVNTIENRWM